MKKMIALILILTLTLSLAACSGGKQTANLDEAPETSATTDTIAETPESTEEIVVTEPAETEPAEIEPVETEPPAPPVTIEEGGPAVQPVETPTEPEPTQPKPTQPSIEPTEPAPTVQPTEPQPTEPKATEPQPTEPKPTTGKHEHDYSYRTEKTFTYCDEDGYIINYCSCGMRQTWVMVTKTHAFVYNTIKEATHAQEGIREVTCLWCPYKATETIPKIDVPYFVRIELVSCERPNSVYLSDGTQLLDKIYGKYNAAQVGDTYTYRIVMSDGGTTGFKVKNDQKNNTDLTVDGNLVTVKVTGAEGNPYISFDVVTNDIDNKRITRGASMKILMGDYNFMDMSDDSIYVILRDYITRNGMESYLTLLNDFNFGDLESYTGGDPSKSISGTAQYGYDDYIQPAVHANWLDMYFNLIDAYKARGFTKVYMYYRNYAIVFKAC